MGSEVNLSELCLTGKGRYGIAASAVDYSPNLPTYLRITDINDNGTLNLSGLKSIDDTNSKKYELREGDIVFARTGASVGRNYLYDVRDGNFVFAGFLIGFTLDKALINPRWVKYYCQSKSYQDWVTSHISGSTRGNINERAFASLPIPVPSRDYQDKAVTLLDSIEDSCRALTQTNGHLYPSEFVLAA
ncbi:restriction endonuclease subunit S [Bifidobacterium callitrichidarum]|uniref:Type I restriction modification DNA specificity domain-containing protein n=1 Tax=Bifidobacterium callitrichidarum TaxID=2052941 RepID=A0A2U2NAU0_9BIFI|nr:restriction endonuclease subunit S [Bifidobacterium callitrichidarum]PWG66208.1 hypothetical protein DF196_04235 [Bifidobacterium callitrichidarum]